MRVKNIEFVFPDAMSWHASDSREIRMDAKPVNLDDEEIKLVCICWEILAQISQPKEDLRI